MIKKLLLISLFLPTVAFSQVTWLKNYSDQNSKLGISLPMYKFQQNNAGLFVGADSKVFTEIFNHGVSGKPFDKAYVGPQMTFGLCKNAGFTVAYTGYMSKLELPKHCSWGLGFTLKF